jgi:hypothetical protein
MAGKLRYAISVTPIETITESFGFSGEVVDIYDDITTRSVDVIMTEVQQTLGCSSADFTLSVDNLTNTTHGFASGAPYYLTAPAVANSSGSTTTLPALAAAQFVYIENTGFEQAASSATIGTTVNTTDYLIVQSHATGTSGIELAVLKANEGVLFPIRGVANSNTFHIRSGNADGDAAGGNTLGAKFLSVT